MDESVTGMLGLCDCKCYFVCIIDNIASDIRYLGCVAPEPESSPLTALSPDTSQIESSPVTQGDWTIQHGMLINTAFL